MMASERSPMTDMLQTPPTEEDSDMWLTDSIKDSKWILSQSIFIFARLYRCSIYMVQHMPFAVDKTISTQGPLNSCSGDHSRPHQLF